MNISQSKCIPIEAYLDRQGVNPAFERKNKNEIWYHSPIREDDKNPSFKVSTIKNLWYDHGAARGGTLLDLVKELCSCDVRDALAHLDKTGLYSSALTEPLREKSTPSPSSYSRNTKSGDENKTAEPLKLISKSELKHPALLQYLEKRAIYKDIATKYLSQINFKAPHRNGNYFGLGFPAGDGFEVRNALFKGFVGLHKDISVIEEENAEMLLIFEGFIDFLSYQTIKHIKAMGASKANGSKFEEVPKNVIVLNSTNLWKRALPYLKNPKLKTIQLFLDIDDAGNAVTEEFMKLSGNANIADIRENYAGFDDLNAWLMSKSKA